MNTPQQIAITIDKVVSTDGRFDNVKHFLSTVGLSTSSVSHMKAGKTPSVEKLYKIALGLNVSMDYLMGRCLSGNISNNSIGGPGFIGNVNAPVTIHHEEKELSSDEKEAIRILRNLTPKNKHKLLGVAYELEEMQGSTGEKTNSA